MDLFCACALLFLWFVRPQDIFSLISGVSLVKYLMYAGIFATFRRPAGLTAAKVWATPIDWLVTAYCVWAIWVTPEHTSTAKEVFTYFSFHMVTALALTSWKKIETYINCWLISLGILALLAVSTHLGFELVEGSARLTTAFHERLTLNTWIFRNPNALGHGVLALIPAGLAWFMMSGGKQRALGMGMIALAAYCVFLTESKGAFLAGAGGLTLLFLFKRPVWFQLVVLLLVWGAGLAALKSLPRMNTLSKDDEGIQGRMIVWQQAKASMEHTGTGVGLKGFQGYVALRVASVHKTFYMPIATHGTYVRHGADLGYVGLMLFAGIFYGGARLLLQAKTEEETEARRAQRTIYALVATTAVSCWVVDRAYHMDYFLLTGLLSAFHRRFLPPEKIEGEDEDEEVAPGTPALALPGGGMATTTKAGTAVLATAAVSPVPAPGTEAPAAASPGTSAGTEAAAPAGPALEAPTASANKDPSAVAAKPVTKEKGETEDDHTDPEPDEFGAIKLKWDRIGVFDVVMMYVLLEVVLYYWDLFSTDFVVF